jgi:hypothetical protein
MPDNGINSETTPQGPDAAGTASRDWRDERQTWRRERREARRRFHPHGLFWGLALVLLGVLFLMDHAGWISGDTWWQALLIGLGVIWIANGLAHYHSWGFRWPVYSSITFGIVLILFGTLFLLGFSQWWPLVLIVAGIAFLFRFFWR